MQHSDSSHNPVLNAYFRLPISMVRGDGIYLYDSSGKRYLDFASGIAVTNLGHNHSQLNKALKDQIDQLWHCSNLFTIPGQQKLAERLVAKTFADKVFFCSSGLEAVESAIKIIRKYATTVSNNSKRFEIITLEEGFHGRSIATLSAGANQAARAGFAPLLEGFVSVPRHNLDALRSAITPNTAAILLEPVLSEGGVYPLDTTYLKAIENLAHEHHLLLCLDEVQTGFGRTGSLFAYQEHGIIPDLMTLAKGFGNGFPLAACLMTDRVASCITPGTHGSTYGGNPLAMAVGNAVLDMFETTDILKTLPDRAHYFRKKLDDLKKRYPNYITEVRGKGLLLGIELKHVTAADVLKACVHAGLAVTKTSSNTVLRLLPPLSISEVEIDEGLALLDHVLETIGLEIHSMGSRS